MMQAAQKTTTAAEYSAIETLRDGRRIEIRALRPDDRADMEDAIARSSAETLRRRFFAPKRGFSEAEIDYYMAVDFVRHVALVAVTEEDGRKAIVAGARYVVVRPGEAELAFAVVDRHQGQGIGAALMRHLVAIARDAGLRELVADILPENAAMLTVCDKTGLPLHTRRAAGVITVTLLLP
jgi:RimJ/RimL family protein N-acetyltransferase